MLVSPLVCTFPITFCFLCLFHYTHSPTFHSHLVLLFNFFKFLSPLFFPYVMFACWVFLLFSPIHLFLLPILYFSFLLFLHPTSYFIFLFYPLFVFLLCALSPAFLFLCLHYCHSYSDLCALLVHIPIAMLFLHITSLELLSLPVTWFFPSFLPLVLDMYPCIINIGPKT